MPRGNIAILFPLAIALNFNKFARHPHRRPDRRPDVLLALWQGRNMAKHFGWLSLLAY
jgi:hypothetical protein